MEYVTPKSDLSIFILPNIFSQSPKINEGVKVNGISFDRYLIEAIIWGSPYPLLIFVGLNLFLACREIAFYYFSSRN